MALNDLVGSTTQNNPDMFFGNIGGNPNTLGGGLASIDDGFFRNRLIEHRDHIGNGIYGNPPPLMSIDGPPSYFQPSPMPVRPPNFIGIQPPTLGIAQPDYSGQFEKFGEKLGGFGETLGGYSGQFEKFGEQLGGLGEQMTGYQDALGSFNEQIGGMGKQFEAVNNKLDSLEKGIASLQQVQPQQQSYNPYASMMGMFNPYNRFSYGRRFG